jgi:hypothetical protein
MNAFLIIQPILAGHQLLLRSADVLIERLSPMSRLSFSRMVFVFLLGATLCCLCPMYSPAATLRTVDRRPSTTAASPSSAARCHGIHPLPSL